MSGMKLLSRLSLDQIGHAPSGPERSPVAQRFGTFFQTLAQLVHLSRLQTGLATGACGLGERLGALLFPGLMPAADRLAMNAQSSGHFSLMNAPVKQLGGFVVAVPIDQNRAGRLLDCPCRESYQKQSDMSLYYARLSRFRTPAPKPSPPGTPFVPFAPWCLPFAIV